LRKIGQNLLLAHPGGKVRKHVADGDARSSYARFPEPNFGVYDDPIAVVHKGENRGAIRKTQETGRAALDALATFQFAPRRWAKRRRSPPGLPRLAGEEQAAIGRHCGLAAGGVVDQDGHHVAADGTELVAVLDPAGAVHLTQTVERPADLMLGVDHVAAGAHGLGLGDLAGGANRRGAGFAPV